MKLRPHERCQIVIFTKADAAEIERRMAAGELPEVLDRDDRIKVALALLMSEPELEYLYGQPVQVTEEQLGEESVVGRSYVDGRIVSLHVVRRVPVLSFERVE